MLSICAWVSKWKNSVGTFLENNFIFIFYCYIFLFEKSLDCNFCRIWKCSKRIAFSLYYMSKQCESRVFLFFLLIFVFTLTLRLVLFSQKNIFFLFILRMTNIAMRDLQGCIIIFFFLRKTWVNLSFREIIWKLIAICLFSTLNCYRNADFQMIFYFLIFKICLCLFPRKF